MFESDEFPGQFETDILAFSDPRNYGNGVRIICGNGSFEADENLLRFNDHKEYNAVRCILGILEGSKEVGN